MDEITKILDQGINAKRNGNYDIALSLINNASTIDPTDDRIYGNRFRILIGLKRYQEALRDLLILANFNQIDKVSFIDPVAQLILSQNIPRFHWDKNILFSSLFSSLKFNPLLIKDALTKHDYLLDFVYRYDFTFYIGHCYIGLNPKIISSNNIQETNFLNLNSALLGNTQGADLRESDIDGLFLVLGLMIGHMNLKPELETKREIVDYFIKHYTEINLNVTQYDKFV